MIDYSNICSQSSNKVKNTSNNSNSNNGNSNNSNSNNSNSNNGITGIKYKNSIYAKLTILFLFLGIYIILNNKNHFEYSRYLKFFILLIFCTYTAILFMIRKTNIKYNNHHYNNTYLLFMIYFTYIIFFEIVVCKIGESGYTATKIFKSFSFGGRGAAIIFIFFFVSILINYNWLDYLYNKKNNDNKAHTQRTLIFLDTGLNYIWLLVFIYFIIYLGEEYTNSIIKQTA